MIFFGGEGYWIAAWIPMIPIRKEIQHQTTRYVAVKAGKFDLDVVIAPHCELESLGWWGGWAISQ